MKYLVIDNNNDFSYKDKWQLFSNRQDAIAMFEELGGRDDWGMGFSEKIGMATMYQSGKVNVVFIPIEEQ